MRSGEMTTMTSGRRRTAGGVLLFLAIFGVPGFLVLVSSFPPAGEQGAGSGEWRPLFEGVEYRQAIARKPRPQRVHVVRVDLAQPGVSFLVTPSNGERPGETDGLKTSSFLLKYGCQVAVNASPFRPVSRKEGEPKDVIGLSISRGEKYSDPAGSYGVLLLGKDNKARIAVPPLDLKGVYNAVGGFRLLLKKGRNVGTDGAIHPRTAVGITRDGRYLLLMVIDGRQRGYSEGATTAETARWLHEFGAYSGLNLDGGGSTSLVISDGKGGCKILNRPIHAMIPGTERVNANHLGVLARPLPGGSGEGSKPAR